MFKSLRSQWQRIRPRPARLWSGLIALALVSAGCSSSNAPSIQSSTTKVTYAMPITVTAVLPYVALERGFWREEGLDVNAQMFSAGRLALDALLAKSAQVMSVSETPLVHAIIQGHKIYVVATVAFHQEVKFIGRRDHGIASPADLRGKAIATLPGTNSDYFMYELLKQYGIPAKDLRLTNMSPPDMVTALVKGSIDGYFAWEPHIYYAKEQLGAKAIMFPAGDLYHGRHCVAMNQDFVTAHPDVVRKLVRGLIKAEEFTNQHPKEAEAIVSKVTGVDMRALDQMWPEIKLQVSLDSEFLTILQRQGDWATSIDNPTSPKPKWPEYIYTDALAGERPASVNLKSPQK